MIVRTATLLRRPPEEVWPLLCSSAMDRDRPCLFRVGVPKPVRCMLPDGEGSVGARRECVSDQGRVRQRITRWDPPAALAFEMLETDLPFASLVVGIEDTFELSKAPCGTAVLRTTKIDVKRAASVFAPLLLFLGLKQVHRYVFRNWARLLARAGAGSARVNG